MALITRKISGVRDTNLFFKGAVIGGANHVSGELYAHGLTLITTLPSIVTVTFVASPASTQVPIPMADIISQIKTQAPLLAPYLIYDGNVHKLAFIEATPANGTGIDKDGTANDLFGFSSTVDTEGTFYDVPGGSAPRLVDIHPLENDVYVITTDE